MEIENKDIPLTDGILLCLSHADHAEDLFHAVMDNHNHLAQFLPWVAKMESVNDYTNYLRNCVLDRVDGKELSYNIFRHGRLVGRIGFNAIDNNNNHTAIGYWLIEDAQGEGIITKGCTKLLELAFTKLNLNRVEILCATENTRSAAIPKRLGFTKEGVLRQVEKIGNRYLDLQVFSILKEEWLNSNLK